MLGEPIRWAAVRGGLEPAIELPAENGGYQDVIRRRRPGPYLLKPVMEMSQVASPVVVAD
jgi:hypothetical protein